MKATDIRKLDKSIPRRISLSDKFWARVTRGQKNECWEWEGYLDPGGYGILNLRGVGRNHHIFAHRLSYYLNVRNPPTDKLVRHTCHNPACVNPNHLLLGTDADNSRDKVEAGHSTAGTKNPKAKLTEHDVQRIKRLRKTGMTLKTIAGEYNVTLSNISAICLGKSWRNV